MQEDEDEGTGPHASPATPRRAPRRCGSPANGTGWLDPGLMHHAVIPEVPPPGARLHYRFGSDSTGWSRAFSAAAQPAPGSATKFLVFNDVGMPAPVLFNTPKRWGAGAAGRGSVEAADQG